MAVVAVLIQMGMTACPTQTLHQFLNQLASSACRKSYRMDALSFLNHTVKADVLPRYSESNGYGSSATNGYTNGYGGQSLSTNGYSSGGYGAGSYGGAGGDKMSNLGAGLKTQHWGMAPVDTVTIH